MNNELTKQPTTTKPLSKIQQFQVSIVNGITSTLKESECELTPYGKKCALNCIAGIVSFLKSKERSFESIDMDLLKISVQNAALLELNYASLPPEIYFDLRGNILTVKPQGAGNEKLVRTYGVGVKELAQPWVILEGDEFILPSYDGNNITPPKWVRKTLSGKAIAVCYRLVKTNGETEYLISGREEVASNLIAHIRQNALLKIKDKDKRGEFYQTLENRTLDDLLSDPELKEYINPTYLSGGSREQMIIRKMKNNALKNYPREYNNSIIQEAAISMFEDVDESLNEKPTETFDVKPVNEDAPLDFEITDEGEIKEEVAKKDDLEIRTSAPKEEKKGEVKVSIDDDLGDDDELF